MKREDYRRWQRTKELVVFQVKLGLDTLLDLTLTPIALGSGLLDILRGSEREQSLLRRVLEVGQRLEHWINLFGEPGHHRDTDGPRVDQWLHHAERRARRQLLRKKGRTGTDESSSMDDSVQR